MVMFTPIQGKFWFPQDQLEQFWHFCSISGNLISPREDSSSTRESIVVGSITATIFLLCCLTIAFTLNYSNKVDDCKYQKVFQKV